MMHGYNGGISRQRRTDLTFALAIISLTVLIVAALVVLNWLGSQPRIVPTAPDLAPEALLPLAEPVGPIQGFHNMQHMPQLPAQSLPAVEGPQANIDLPLTRWDWGTIPRQPLVRQTFPIQNKGDQPLLITNVVTSCGCTTADLTSSLIPAGQRADLTVVFDPDFHEASGPVTRLVWLETNDPDMPVVELRLDAVVKP